MEKGIYTIYHAPQKHYLLPKILPELFWNYRCPIWVFSELISKNYPIPSVFVWVAWHCPPETPLIAELFFITVTRFDVFRINWVMFSWQMVSGKVGIHRRGGLGPWKRKQGGFLWWCAKCSKSRDLIAIAICDSNRESQITSDLKQCEQQQKSPLYWLVVQEFGIAILTAIWTGVQITNRAIWKCDLNRFLQRFGGNSCDLGSAISNH